VTLAVVTGLAASPGLASAQFKKRMLQVAFCAGGGALSKEVGKRLTELAVRNAKSLNTNPDAIRAREKQIRIGTAAVLCLTGAALAGTVYDKVSKRDMEARRNEIQSAVNEADPVSREYVLPESGMRERVTTTDPYQDGDKTCRETVVRTSDNPSADPALAVWCKKGNGGWEPELSGS
jgi:hypothetical protein